MLKRLFNSTKMAEVRTVLEDGVEKIVQYGQKTLKIMKPETQKWVEIQGIGRVTEGFAPYYTNQGFKVVGKHTTTTKDVWVENALDGTVERLTTTIAPNNYGKMEKSLNHVIDYGASNARQNLMLNNQFIRGYTGRAPIIPIS